MVGVEGLTFSYPGSSSPAISHLEFKIGAGEVFGLLGPSGAGKSTTQNILTGLLQGWTGRVEVLGRSVQEWRAEYYRMIGVSFEFPNHYLKLSARENLEYFRALYDGNTDKVEDVLALVGLEDHMDKAVGEFSKGMKNRLNLARSLLHRPKLWFLDEPTSGLDPVSILRIRDLIRGRQNLGVTTLIATHDMKTAEVVCDRVAFIVDGRVAAVDAPDSLRRRYGRKEVEVRWEVRPDGEAAAERFPLDGLADNPRFLEALRNPGLSGIHSLETTLEDVFVQVTGSVLE